MTASDLHVRRMEITKPTDEERELHMDKYVVEHPTGDLAADHQGQAIVERMGEKHHMLWCVRCRARAFLEQPCGHLIAVRRHLGE